MFLRRSARGSSLPPLRFCCGSGYCENPTTTMPCATCLGRPLKQGFAATQGPPHTQAPKSGRIRTAMGNRVSKVWEARLLPCQAMQRVQRNFPWSHLSHTYHLIPLGPECQHTPWTPNIHQPPTSPPTHMQRRAQSFISPGRRVSRVGADEPCMGISALGPNDGLVWLSISPWALLRQQCCHTGLCAL